MIKRYIKLNLASPAKILKWSERRLPNKKLVGRITKPMSYKNNFSKLTLYK